MQRKIRIFMDDEGNSAIIKQLPHGTVEGVFILQDTIINQFYKTFEESIIRLNYYLRSNIRLIYEVECYGGIKQENITNKNSDIFEL